MKILTYMCENCLKPYEFNAFDNNEFKCSTYQFANIKKISVTFKVTNTALFGLLGTKRYKTFQCNNCGTTW